MEDSNLLSVFTEQISQVKAAVRSILLLDKNISVDDRDSEVAGATMAAFQTHAPDFYEKQSGTPDGKFKVDIAIKGVFLETVQAAGQAKQRVMQYCIEGANRPSIPQLLDLARYLATIQLAEMGLSLQVIAELVELCIIDEGADIFLYLEACVPDLKSRFSFETQGAAPKLNVLKICNTLLRRLSRAQHVQLAGRIHLFLSQLLPAMDRSAVNSMGNVNDSHAIEIEDVPEGFLGTDGQPVDAEFYRQFWGLQQIFQNPTSAADANLWLQVHAGIKAALARFAKVKPSMASGGISSEQEGLTVKYLSSPKLLHLQLRDAGFRRHFLVQCLALLQACSRKSLARQETFRIKQQGDAEDLQALLYKELERTPPHGPQFSQAIAALMRQEDLWADWKANGAKSFERPEAHLESHVPPPKRRRINRQDAVNLGTRELTRLWNLTPDNLSAIHKNARKHVPSLREFLNPVVEEMDPEEGIEEQYKRKGDPVYRWEALRRISKASPLNLAAVVRSKDQDLEEAVRIIFPDDVPAGAKTSAPAGDSSVPPASPAPSVLCSAADGSAEAADGAREATEPLASTPNKGADAAAPAEGAVGATAYENGSAEAESGDAKCSDPPEGKPGDPDAEGEKAAAKPSDPEAENGAAEPDGGKPENGSGKPEEPEAEGGGANADNSKGENGSGEPNGAAAMETATPEPAVAPEAADVEMSDALKDAAPPTSEAPPPS